MRDVSREGPVESGMPERRRRLPSVWESAGEPRPARAGRDGELLRLPAGDGARGQVRSVGRGHGSGQASGQGAESGQWAGVRSVLGKSLAFDESRQ